MQLDEGQVHLWLAYADVVQDGTLYDEYRLLMTDKERIQERRLVRAVDRRRYVLTRASLRCVLSRYFPIAPAQWSFSTNAYGKPAIDNRGHGAETIAFNVSHTSGLIIVAVTLHSALGVDAENLRVDRVPYEVAERFFSRSEAAELNGLPTESKRERFFDYWTLKEAYIKARGMGLSIPLDQVAFSFADDRRIAVSISPLADDRPSRWAFWQFRPSDDHSAAICVERTSRAMPQLVTWCIDPLQNDMPITCGAVRVSE